jgi:hypothetical protein
MTMDSKAAAAVCGRDFLEGRKIAGLGGEMI